MGAEPYSYYVAYESDIHSALQKLRRREFKAGRYQPGFDLDEDPLGEPGARHGSIEQAREAAAEDGTCSILDIDRISQEPEFGAAAPVGDAALLRYFGTTQPTCEMIEECDALWDDLERGHAIYLIAYAGGVPEQIYFAGYSFD